MFRRGEDDRKEPVQPREIEADPPASGPSRGGSSTSEVTVVGQGARLEGTLVSAGSLRIDGQVKGKIKAEGDVTLSGSSRVEADIEAQNVTVAGEFTGAIVAKSRAELASGGRVNGDVTSKTLVVAEGAVFSGQSIMGNAGGGGGGGASAGGRPAASSNRGSTEADAGDAGASSAAEPATAGA
jgi:cytoskeletal protein CcmA (bactofilin family)